VTRQLRTGLRAILGVFAGLWGAATLSRPLRFGVHGIMNAGKTAFQTVLYMTKTFDGGRLSYDDTHTIEYLRQSADYLKKHGATRSTIQGNPDRLLYELVVSGKTYGIEAREYSGALVDVGTPLEHLVQEVLAFNVHSDALLLLVDSSARDDRQLDALNVLLKRLTSARPPLGSPRRPMGIVWTKVDRLTPLDGDPATIEQRVRQQLRNHDVFRTVDQLSEESEGPYVLKSFFVSVYGHELTEGRAVAREDIKPFNLHAPILWAADEATKVVAARRQKRTWAVAAGLLACAALFVGLREAGRRHAVTQYREVVAFRQAHPEDDEAGNRLDRGQRLRYSVWARWFLLDEDRRQLEQCVEEDRAADERRTYTTVVRRRAGLQGEEKAAERIALVAVAKYRSGTYRGQYDGFAREDTEIDYWYRERIEREGIVAAARDVAAGSGRDLYDRCRRFEQAFPRTRDVNGVRAAREAACRQWRDDLFVAARRAEAVSPQDFEKSRALYRACLEVPGNGNDSEALDAISRIDDREQYHVLRETLSSARDWDALTRARALAETYVNADRKGKKMLGAVREFQGWVADVNAGRVTCSFEMVPVSFPYESDLWRVGDGDLCDVSLTLSGKSATAQYNYDRQTSGFDLKGSLPVRWGDYPAVALELRNARYRANTAAGTATIGDLFSGGGRVRCPVTEAGSKRQYQVTIGWKCDRIEEFRRKLPHYGD
jgi:hypothetical protein